MRQDTSSTADRTPVDQQDAPSTPDQSADTSPRAGDEQALWAMTAEERVAAMWRSQLTLQQLARWSSRAPHEVPLLGGEFAWIAMRTPDWAEAVDDHPKAA
jgi:hypothetical protein